MNGLSDSEVMEDPENITSIILEGQDFNHCAENNYVSTVTGFNGSSDEEKRSILGSFESDIAPHDREITSMVNGSSKMKSRNAEDVESDEAITHKKMVNSTDSSTVSAEKRKSHTTFEPKNCIYIDKESSNDSKINKRIDLGDNSLDFVNVHSEKKPTLSLLGVMEDFSDIEVMEKLSLEKAKNIYSINATTVTGGNGKSDEENPRISGFFGFTDESSPDSVSTKVTAIRFSSVPTNINHSSRTDHQSTKQAESYAEMIDSPSTNLLNSSNSFKLATKDSPIVLDSDVIDVSINKSKVPVVSYIDCPETHEEKAISRCQNDLLVNQNINISRNIISVSSDSVVCSDIGNVESDSNRPKENLLKAYTNNLERGDSEVSHDVDDINCNVTIEGGENAAEEKNTVCEEIESADHNSVNEYGNKTSTISEIVESKDSQFFTKEKFNRTSGMVASEMRTIGLDDTDETTEYETFDDVDNSKADLREIHGHVSNNVSAESVKGESKRNEDIFLSDMTNLSGCAHRNGVGEDEREDTFHEFSLNKDEIFNNNIGGNVETDYARIDTEVNRYIPDSSNKNGLNPEESAQKIKNTASSYQSVINKGDNNEECFGDSIQIKTNSNDATMSSEFDDVEAQHMRSEELMTVNNFGLEGDNIICPNLSNINSMNENIFCNGDSTDLIFKDTANDVVEKEHCNKGYIELDEDTINKEFEDCESNAVKTNFHVEYNSFTEMGSKSEECCICFKVGDDLICCRNCKKLYHMDCHVPPMHVLSPDEWQCFQCSDVKDQTLLTVTNDNQDECYICSNGGELICCDFCEKSFHLQCHIPRLYEIPKGKWKCCECKATSFKRKQRCGECKDCLIPNCKKCLFCLSMKQYGGDRRQGKACKNRPMCKFMRFASSEKMHMHTQNLEKCQSIKDTNTQHLISGCPHNVKKQSNKLTYHELAHITSSTDKYQRFSLLRSIGWIEKHTIDSRGGNTKHWLSPKLNLEFFTSVTALKFVQICLKCNRNEQQAFINFCQNMKNEGKPIADYVVGGARALNLKKSEISGSKMDIKASQQHQTDLLKDVNQPAISGKDDCNSFLRSLGWKEKIVPQSNHIKRTHFLSPKLNLEFRYSKAALYFSKLCAKFKKNEDEAFKIYCQELLEQKITLSTRVIGGASAIAQSSRSKTKIYKSSYTNSKMNLSKKSCQKKPEVLNNLRQQQFLSKKGDGKNVLKHFSIGWSILNCSGHTHFKTPSLGIIFRSHIRAIEFDEFLKRNHMDEFKTLKMYVERLGMNKAKCIIRNIRGYGLEGKVSHKLMTSVKDSSTVKKRKEATFTTHARKKQKPNLSHKVCTAFQNSPFSSYVPSTPANEIDGEVIQSIISGPIKQTFFIERFRGRVLLRKHSLGDLPPERTFCYNGFKYELASSKIERKSGQRFDSQKMVDLIYIATKGRGMMTINLQDELDKLCGFGSLGVKVCARLEHLQSQVKSIYFIDYSNIEVIEENGHEGCGFIPTGFFHNIEPSIKEYDCIQIRIVAPKLGLIKGMLLEKNGITRIQIPNSMIKAGPSYSHSLEHDNDNWAALMVKNIFPSIDNSYYGRLLDPDEFAPNSFMTTQRKALSEMYVRMLIGFGVPKDAVKAYKTRARHAASIRHAHLKGVADPTGKISYGKVFIPGYATSANNDRDLFGKCLKHKQVYISRSPCLEPTDAKLLPVIGSKPKEMSKDDWNHLCSFKFGTIIFGLPKSKKDIPLPCMIADGDLDGDDYFALWDEEILDHMLLSNSKLVVQSRKLLQALQLPENGNSKVVKSSNLSRPYDKNWLIKAQDKMLEFEYQKAASSIVGKLYSLCKKKSERSDGTYNIYDEDACAYAKAYKDAMDIQKHGGKIYLPEHLSEALTEAQRRLLISN